MFYINLERETTERYDSSRFMEYTHGIYDCLTSYFYDKILSLPIEGYFVVQDEGLFPDLVSFRLYGRYQYWFILLLYNGMLGNEELEDGMILKYPSLDSIEEVYFQLMTRIRG